MKAAGYAPTSIARPGKMLGKAGVQSTLELEQEAFARRLAVECPDSDVVGVLKRCLRSKGGFLSLKAADRVIEYRKLVPEPKSQPTNAIQVNVNLGLQAELDRELERMVKTVNPPLMVPPKPQ